MNIETEMKVFEKDWNLWFHLDIMDGYFVPNFTFGGPVVRQMHKITDIPLDAHLMVNNPEFHIDLLKDAHLENITFHFEASQRIEKTIEKAKTLYKSVGISIKPNTSPDELSDDMLRAIDLVLVMSVEPGFGGQSFMPNSLDKIRALKRRREDLGTSFQIQVDGGVKEENAPELWKAGADNLVAGSYIFKAGPENYHDRIQKLRK